MSDEAALLAAIAAHPEEDTPRLAYADWLDEHDRHTRAEFIRVQIEITHKETLPRVIQNRYVDLWKRNQELIDGHRAELLGTLAGLPNTVKVEFRRGFVSELTLDCGTLLGFAEALGRLQPLPDITVTDVAWWLWRAPDDDLPARLFPALRLATAAEMQSPRRPVPITPGSDEMSEGFAFHGPYPRLARLNLEFCAVGDAGLRAVIGAQEHSLLPALTALDVSGNGLTDDGVRALVESPLWPRLRHLVLGGNPIGDDAAEAIADAAGTSRLEHLNVRFTNIGPRGQQALLSRFGGKVDLF